MHILDVVGKANFGHKHLATLFAFFDILFRLVNVLDSMNILKVEQPVPGAWKHFSTVRAFPFLLLLKVWPSFVPPSHCVEHKSHWTKWATKLSVVFVRFQVDIEMSLQCVSFSTFVTLEIFDFFVHPSNMRVQNFFPLVRDVAQGTFERGGGVNFRYMSFQLWSIFQIFATQCAFEVCDNGLLHFAIHIADDFNTILRNTKYLRFQK